LQLLEKIEDSRFRSIVIYRLERKKIIQTQLHLCEFMIGLVKSGKLDYMK
jgi:hypothetical protein